jgi:hypothetical protein
MAYCAWFRIQILLNVDFRIIIWDVEIVSSGNILNPGKRPLSDVVDSDPTSVQ